MATMIKRTTVGDLQERRRRAGPLRAGVAALASSDDFKDLARESAKPLAKDWSTHLSPENKSRPPCILKQAASRLNTPGIISLGGGIPSSKHFPIDGITMHIPDHRTPSTPESELGTRTIYVGKDDVQEGAGEFDVSIALNYGQATGAPQLLRFVTEHTELLFDPPYADWRVCLTAGSTSAIEQSVRMLCDRGRRDSILVEEYTFPTAFEIMQPQGINVVGVAMDEDGIVPRALDDLLRSWDEASPTGFRKPHVLYTVPTGQNPTGITQSLQRRQAIYKICQLHNIFIIEDDPYYHLRLQAYNSCQGSPQCSKTASEYLEQLLPTYLSMDVDGRVLRIDSFAKVLTPGARLGWITASKQVVQHYVRHAEVANQGPSGISQLLVWKLIDATWGHDGYLCWISQLCVEYTRKRNSLLAACEEFLPKDLVTWSPPDAGMFLWIRVDHLKHPESPNYSVQEIEVELYERAIENGVLCARGSWFKAESKEARDAVFLRLTFASASQQEFTEAVRRLRDALHETFRLQ